MIPEQMGTVFLFIGCLFSLFFNVLFLERGEEGKQREKNIDV